MLSFAGIYPTRSKPFRFAMRALKLHALSFRHVTSIRISSSASAGNWLAIPEGRAPFLLVMVGLCVSLWIGLLDDIQVHGHFEDLEGRTDAVEAGS